METGKRKQIESLQALRALAIISVMLSHTQLRYVSGAGAWGVTIFFVLSGFVLMYQYFDTNCIKKVSFLTNLQFAKHKIRNIYLLHILTTLAITIFFFIGNSKEDYTFVLVRLGLNVLLLQEWIPLAGRSINGVAWYLCVAVFCYFFFPWVLRFMENKQFSRKKALRWIVILTILQIILGFLGSRLPSPVYGKNGWWDTDMVVWFCYHFPLTRGLDFILGCNIGYLFLTRNRDDALIPKKEILISIFTVVVILIENALFIWMKHKAVGGDLVPTAHPERWWTYSALFRLSSCSFVYLMAMQNGKLATLLTNRFTCYVGNISQHLFLIHPVVFLYLNKAIEFYGGPTFCIQYIGWIKLTAGTVLSLVIARLWMLMIRK
ncbi:MAG TPA: acyltransferase [Lachnospiraceae bacterium]|nr:acyltransferase [Lachnospiraceae bacterium]HPF28508.1 acyltransferase [Lachnospiraceae bacterium]